MGKKRMLAMFCAGVLSLVLLAGCGVSGETTESSENPAVGDTTSEAENTQETPAEPVDWMQGGYQMPYGLDGNRGWVCVDSCVLDIPEPEFDYTAVDVETDSCTSLGSSFYVLRHYVLETEEGEKSRRHRLYWLDESGESHWADPFWGEAASEGEIIIQGINAVGDGQLAVLFVPFRTDNYRVLFWNLESGESHIVDLFQAGVSLEFVRSSWFDADGYIYVPGKSAAIPEGGSLYVLGEKDTPGQAELLRTIEVENLGNLSLYSRMSDGTPLVCMDHKLVYVNMVSGEEQELATLTNSVGDTAYIDEMGNMYFTFSKTANLWNPVAKKFEILADIASYGYDDRKKQSCIGMSKTGKLMVMTEKQGKIVIYCFGPAEEETGGTLRLANLWYNDSDVKSAAVAYSMQHPDGRITYEADWGNQDGFYERIMAQMAVGQGPDLLFVHGEDMDRLNARGLLADLTDVLDGETRSQLFSGVMTAGLRDGKLVGLPAAVSGRSMLTVDANWQGNNWTIAEVAELWRQRKGQGAWRFLPQRWSQEEMLEYLLLADMANSPFIDWENHRCDFDNDLFRQMLEMIGERSVLDHTNLDIEEEYETAQQVMDGVYLADVVYGGSIFQYVAKMEYYKGESHFVGFPTESGNGNMLTCYGFVVVNTRTEHWEEVADFLRLMYSKEFQTDNPEYLLRKDVLREGMAPDDQTEGYEIFTLTGMRVPLKKDGSSYVEDYIAFMDKCRAETRSTEEIVNIIREETSGYFQNIQNLDNTVRLIQSRVQLYLKENGN